MNKITRKRGVILLFSFIFISFIVAIALFKLQINGYNMYQDYVIEQMMVETNVNPNRGIIYDRNGEILATNETVWVLYAMPKNIKNADKISNELYGITGINKEKIYKKIVNRGYKYQIIDNNIDEETSQIIREYIDNNGLEDQLQLSASAKRLYPYSSLASHMLGFVNADGIGIYGLEKAYNNVLEGTSGKYITAQNAQSGDMPFQFEEYIENDNSYDIVTTIDLYMQYQLESQLKTAAIESGAQNRATGIIMCPKTGEIYAMATYPSFDLNNPYKLDDASQNKLNEYEKSSKEYKNMYLELLYTMWKNKAITELYEPGSTFKLFTTSVALQENPAVIKKSFSCSGSLKIDGFYRAISCHKRTGHGQLTFAEALQQSCNPSMMNIAFSLGKNKFYTYFEKFGYTSKTGIDLPSEAKGYYHNYNSFSNVSLAVYSFGQTFKTTPIQQLRAISIVANGGYRVTPHILKSIVDKDGKIAYEYASNYYKEKVLESNVCSDISLILKEGVDGLGGAKNAYVAGYNIAAKTGTSEKKDKFDENGNTPYRVSSCIAYAPSEDAEIAIIFIVDEPTVGSAYGSVVAAPYVSKLMELILPYVGIEPNYEGIQGYTEVAVPDLESMQIEEAKKIIDKTGLKYEIVGDGTKVEKQSPSKGTVLYKESGTVYLYTSLNQNYGFNVPNVIGKTAAEANKILVNAGFNVKIVGVKNDSSKNVKILKQYPEPGVAFAKGELITIEVLYVDETE